MFDQLNLDVFKSFLFKNGTLVFISNIKFLFKWYNIKTQAMKDIRFVQKRFFLFKS